MFLTSEILCASLVTTSHAIVTAILCVILFIISIRTEQYFLSNLLKLHLIKGDLIATSFHTVNASWRNLRYKVQKKKYLHHNVNIILVGCTQELCAGDHSLSSVNQLMCLYGRDFHICAHMYAKLVVTLQNCFEYLLQLPVSGELLHDKYFNSFLVIQINKNIQR